MHMTAELSQLSHFVGQITSKIRVSRVSERSSVMKQSSLRRLMLSVDHRAQTPSSKLVSKAASVHRSGVPLLSRDKCDVLSRLEKC